MKNFGITLMLTSASFAFSQDDSQRAALNLSEHVAGYTEFVYDSLRISDLSLLNGKEEELRWRPDGYYRFNKPGGITEQGTFGEDGTSVTKYAYDLQNRLLHTTYYFEGVCLYRDLEFYNSSDKLDYRKRITCENEADGFFMMKYDGETLAEIVTVDKDSTTILAREKHQLDPAADRITILGYEGDSLVNMAIFRQSTGRIISQTDYLFGQELYFTYNYTYTLDGKLLEEQRISVTPEKTDTTWLIYEIYDPGYRVLEYHRNAEGKVVMTEINYFNLRDMLVKTEYITKTRRVYDTWSHQFKYDQYGNWIYDITYHKSQPVSVVWRKLTYY
jgi:hypothetical protein